MAVTVGPVESVRATRPDRLLQLLVSRHAAAIVVITVTTFFGILTATPPAPWSTHPNHTGSGTCTGPFRALWTIPDH